MVRVIAAMRKVLVFCLAYPLASPALLQAGEEGFALIEEVVVTARKREENLLDTPLSVSALSAADLERVQIDDLGDVQNIVPNTSINIGDAANAIIYIRGVGQRDSLSFADPGVGVYLDDVYLGRAQGSFLEVIDVQRVEVLRGPQGTLYGRNTIGGAIKYVSAAPSDVPLIETDLSVGRYDEYRLKGTWSGPLNPSGSLLARASLAYIAHDGYNRNVFAGAADATDGDKDTLAWRAQLHYEPNEDLSIRLSMDRSVNDPDRSITPVRVTQGPTLVAATASFQPGGSPFAVAADFNDLERLEAEGAAVALDYRLSEAVGLKSITSFRQLEHATHIDLDGTGFEIFGVHVDQNQEQFSQELQISYDSGGAVKALLGAYYFSEDDVSPDGISNAEPINFGVFFSPYGTVSENDQSVQASAVFGEISWFLTPNLEFTAGLRYTDEAKRLRRKACQNLAILGTVLPSVDECNPPADSSNPFALNLDLDKNFSKFTPKLALSYSSESMGLAYFTYARGFKSGGFDGRIGYNGASDADAVATQAEPYDPEVADTYELGWKASLSDGRLRLSTALFYNDYQDLQLSSFSATPEGGFATVFTNAGKAETYGVEAELLASPMQNLLLSFNLGYLKADYREFINSQMQDVSDALTPINSPEFSSNLGLQYRHPLGFAWLELGADLSYRSAYYVEINNLSALKQEGFALVNASIGLEGNQGKWGLSFGVKNLTDKAYITHGFDLTAFPGIGLAYYGEPLTYRFGVRYRFL